uniref:Uncharacterized protein LOC104238181 n=1 Tax=Nicotiana sylvestris TaxID=4096 RepID=A0A1U7XFC7_NICSY|nr:PREDICTED: uncharacterized protein LOC104238181 [Nicotiana sylvestris]
MGQCVSTFACQENRRTISLKHGNKDVSVSSKSNKKEASGNKKHKVSAASGCYAMIKEQRSRFYIIRRCVFMLIFWHRHSKI